MGLGERTNARLKNMAPTAKAHDTFNLRFSRFAPRAFPLSGATNDKRARNGHTRSAKSLRLSQFRQAQQPDGFGRLTGGRVEKKDAMKMGKLLHCEKYHATDG